MMYKNYFSSFNGFTHFNMSRNTYEMSMLNHTYKSNLLFTPMWRSMSPFNLVKRSFADLCEKKSVKIAEKYVINFDPESNYHWHFHTFFFVKSQEFDPCLLYEKIKKYIILNDAYMFIIYTFPGYIDYGRHILGRYGESPGGEKYFLTNRQIFTYDNFKKYFLSRISFGRLEYAYSDMHICLLRCHKRGILYDLSALNGLTLKHPVINGGFNYYYGMYYNEHDSSYGLYPSLLFLAENNDYFDENTKIIEATYERDYSKHIKEVKRRLAKKERRSIARMQGRKPGRRNHLIPHVSLIQKRGFSSGGSSNNTTIVDRDVNNVDMLRYDMYYIIGSYFERKGYKANNKIQSDLERTLMDPSSSEMKKKLTPLKVHKVDTRLLGGESVEVIKENRDLIIKYINSLLKSTEKEEMINLILNRVGASYLFDICIYFLFKIASESYTNDSEFIRVTGVYIKVGNFIVDKYLRDMKEKMGGSKEKYRVWLDRYKKENPSFTHCLDDTFYASVGANVLDVLKFAGLLTTKVVKERMKEAHHEFIIQDKRLLIAKDLVLMPPIKLPMIVPPKSASITESGGYLLNEEDYYEDKFTSKKSYQKGSSIRENNTIIHLINGLSKVPFKVNKELLDFILNNPQFHLLIDSKEVEDISSIDNLSKYKQKKAKSLRSKYILQENILRIVEIYKNFNEIYFPVKLDQRGRLYCINAYFNYQSNDLAKSLILFSVPGIINKGDLNAIKYFKAYGVNCYGNNLEKSSLSIKSRWVEENKENILNYENGVLLAQAKEKLLFLAFCIEYKKYNEFILDDSRTKWKTYLPIQLDATCNGFQHLSLLSQEDKLYSELNLTNKEDIPKDFYTFLLHKLCNYIEDKLLKGVESEGKASYKRLKDFVWTRDHVKKVIMTIPYNASERTMKEHILDNLVLLDSDVGIKDRCYTDGTEKNKNLVICNYDVDLIIKLIKKIIKEDFIKIDRLIKYLRNVAKLCNSLNLPIYWSLPNGLEIYQSYLESKSITISPFKYNKIKLNLKVSVKDKFDYDKQTRALMPNLIHSLDAYSMTSLYYHFSEKMGKNCQFYSVHDCFGTTIDKVEILKNILVYVYVELYSDDGYLQKFDRNIINYIKDNTKYEWDGRTINIKGNKYELFDIDWVINDALLLPSKIKEIDNQHILL